MLNMFKLTNKEIFMLEYCYFMPKAKMGIQEIRFYKTMVSVYTLDVIMIYVDLCYMIYNIWCEFNGEQRCWHFGISPHITHAVR